MKARRRLVGVDLDVATVRDGDSFRDVEPQPQTVSLRTATSVGSEEVRKQGGGNRRPLVCNFDIECGLLSAHGYPDRSAFETMRQSIHDQVLNRLCEAVAIPIAKCNVDSFQPQRPPWICESHLVDDRIAQSMEIGASRAKLETALGRETQEFVDHSRHAPRTRQHEIDEPGGARVVHSAEHISCRRNRAERIAQIVPEHCEEEGAFLLGVLVRRSVHGRANDVKTPISFGDGRSRVGASESSQFRQIAFVVV